ncbi:MAG TPA: exosortase/archaeosortase family protein [Tepidisphaeraceae bacterium]|jgi:exosortase|nr:exosortase/archaeosortase family protein [Tepidisphaeraceae bacterium]
MIIGLKKHGWTSRRILAALAVVALAIVATLPAWLDVAHIAKVDDEASHVFLVPIVVAWLIWVRRGRFRYCLPRPTFLGPLCVAFGWLISSWGYHNAVQSFWHGGAVLVVIGALLSVVGRDLLLRFTPAFAVLVFLVPIPGTIRQGIAIPMQNATARATQTAFDILGEPIQRNGNQLSIEGTVVNVAEACNGMRMVFTLVLVSYAFAFGEPLRGYVRFLILAASPLSAIGCNVIRMIPTIWLYGHGSREVADWFHSIAGWAMLGIAFLLLMAIIRLLKWALIPVSPYMLAMD